MVLFLGLSDLHACIHYHFYRKEIPVCIVFVFLESFYGKLIQLGKVLTNHNCT